MATRLWGLRLPERLLLLVHAAGMTHGVLLVLPPSPLRRACLLCLGCWPNRRKHERVLLHCWLVLLRAVCCAEAQAGLLQLLPVLLPVLVMLQLLLLLGCLRIPAHRPQ